MRSVRGPSAVTAAAVAAAVSLTAALAGCGSSGGSAGTAAPAATAGSTAATAPGATATPAPGGVATPLATPTASLPAEVPATPTSAAENAFLTTVRARHLTGQATITATQQLTLGRLTCALSSTQAKLPAAQRATVSKELGQLIQRATKGTPAQASQFLAVSNRYLCPTTKGPIVAQ